VALEPLPKAKAGAKSTGVIVMAKPSGWVMG
jgi:hypothetical protein